MSLVFAVCATLSVAGALGMLLSKRAVHSALFVALTMINLAVLYLQLSAPFLGMVQIIVYTGAVMMLFLFVLMIVGVDSSDSLTETLRGQRAAAIAIAVGLGLLLTSSIGSALIPSGNSLDATFAGGNVQAIANLMFGKYVLALEVTAALLVTAAVGAMVLAHRERITPKLSQRAQQQARFADYALTGKHPGPLPPSGVYARHNAVDTPALLPDGSIAPSSVPAPLQARGSVREPDQSGTQQVADLTEGNVVIEGGQDGRN
ncbi:MAG: NADH-quinone oxidoreductase subunit J [Candidatus Nanopelagicales bacterium]|jgi:NADH-quinone oxidoreductase subunit J